MVRMASGSSSLIIDEFGKGTLAADGVGLLPAVVNHFANSAASPRAVFATHFSELQSSRHVPVRDAVSFYTMR